MTDIERREIFAHRAWKKVDGEDVMNYSGFKCALADAERRFNERPAPDQDGAEEVLKNLFGSGSFQFSYSIDQCLQAMTTHARNEVAKAVAEKDAEIERLKEFANYRLTLSNNLTKQLADTIDELTEAKKRIAELENRTEMKLPPNYERQ